MLEVDNRKKYGEGRNRKNKEGGRNRREKEERRMGYGEQDQE